jgi:hypothetical protein
VLQIGKNVTVDWESGPLCLSPAWERVRDAKGCDAFTDDSRVIPWVMTRSRRRPTRRLVNVNSDPSSLLNVRTTDSRVAAL